ncbi:uncharacterized protein LOC108865175 [Galendromus occidentalis]|uniref:Uncharacterized protein LOC108865175 n=1 Tax=Galendromus occidentalis TaxID=34638 RepID=A0AAJ7L8W6_9ACAR|nr:uncharacterized protein LOC108865175 [Galendromus occidentalis]
MATPEDSEPSRENIDVRKELRTLRQRRTIRRNRIKTEIAGIEGLSAGNPKFRDDQSPDVLLEVVSQHLSRVREFTEQVCGLLDDEDLEREITESEAFEAEIDAVIAMISAVAKRSANSSASAEQTFYGTPQGVRHVRFRPAFESTMIPPSTNRQTPGTPISNDSSSSTSVHRAAEENIVSRHPVERAVPAPSNSAFAPTPGTIARLPRELDISPEVFSGERLKLRSFITQFRCFVGKRPDAAPIEKLMILRKYLRDGPKDIVQALELTDANYKVAMTLLENNYSRVDTETQRLLAELRNLPKIAKAYDFACLRKFLTLIQGHTAILTANGIPLISYALTLKSSMESAMPPRMRQDFKDEQRMEEKFTRSSETMPEGRPDAIIDKTVLEVEKLMRFLRRRVQDLEDNKYLDAITNPSEHKKFDSQRKPMRERRLDATVAGVLDKSQRSRFKIRPCLFCKTEEHNSSHCQAELSLEKRREILRDQKRCPSCFMSAHQSPKDCRGPRFPCAKCNSNQHYAPMHPKPTPAASAGIGEVSAGLDSTSNALLWTSSAYVVNGGLKIPIRIFIDGGNSIRVMLPSLRRMLRESPVGARDLNLQAFASSHSIRGAPVFNVRLTGPFDKKVIEIFALEHEFGIHPPNDRPPRVAEAIRRFDESRPVADRTLVDGWTESPPAILVGMDQMHKIVNCFQLPVAVVDNIVAQPSRFGWLIGGPTSTENHVDATVTAAHVLCCAAATKSDPLPITPAAKALQTLWSLESVGIAGPPSATQMSADDDSALRQFRSGLEFRNNRYAVSFPKRETICLLPSNKEAALRRLERELSQLTREPAKYQRYHQEIMKFIDKGHAAETKTHSLEAPAAVDGTYFMPHHEVITRKGNIEKWRIVFDCSSKEKGATSLNEHLLPGPNLNPQLVC